MEHQPLSEKEERIGKCILDSAFAVHRALGPGLLESIYEVCFCHELKKRGLSFQRQVTVPLVYDGIEFEEGLRLDVLVEGLVICELKAVETVNQVFAAQLLSQLKLSGKRLGYLINFNSRLLRQGIQRVIL